MLLAALRDEIVILRNCTIASAGSKPPKFEPTPRPGVTPAASGSRRQLTEEQRRALDPRMRNQPKEA